MANQNGSQQTMGPLEIALYSKAAGLPSNTQQALRDYQNSHAIAQTLLQQGLTPIDTNNRMSGQLMSRVSPLEPIAKIAQALAGKYADDEANQTLSAALSNQSSPGGQYQRTGDQIIDSMSPEMRQQYEINKLPSSMGGNPEVAQKIYEFSGAGPKKLAESQNTIMTDANGIPFLPNVQPLKQLSQQNQLSDNLSSANNAPALNQYRQEEGMPTPPSSGGSMPTRMPTQPPILPVFGGQALPTIPQVNASELNPNVLPGSQNKLPNNLLDPIDQKPIIPGIESSLQFKPDPTKQTNFIPPNSSGPMGKVQADSAKDQDATARKQYGELDSTLSNLTTQKFYAQKLADVYKDMASPSAMSQYPEIAQKAYNLGLITDPSNVKSLSDVQRALYLNNQSVLANLKAQSAGLDPDHPMRIFGSEVNANLENAVAPDLTPEARFHNIANTMALINRNIGSINAYNSPSVGGLGNRLNAGTTMAPTEFMQKYIASHEPNSKLAEKEMPVFKGMQQNTQQNQSVGSWGDEQEKRLQELLAKQQQR